MYDTSVPICIYIYGRCTQLWPYVRKWIFHAMLNFDLFLFKYVLFCDRSFDACVNFLMTNCDACVAYFCILNATTLYIMSTCKIPCQHAAWIPNGTNMKEKYNHTRIALSMITFFLHDKIVIKCCVKCWFIYLACRHNYLVLHVDIIYQKM